MSDPLQHWIPDTVTKTCEECGVEQPVTEFSNILNGAWEFDFDCRVCLHRNRGSGYALERGASTPVFTLRMVGYALILIGCLGHSHWSWPLIATGVSILAAIRIITAFVNANRNLNGAPHE